MIRVIVAVAVLAMFATQAEAKYQPRQIEFDRHSLSSPWGGPQEATASQTKRQYRAERSHRRIAVGALDRPRSRSIVRARHQEDSPGRTATQILPHPEGCPRTAFCGCATSLRVFGKNIREAWMAAWWLRFPIAEPAPGMVAVKGRHHVLVILEVRGQGNVLAYDPNSGGHQTRIHVRSLAGFSVRNPHHPRYANL